MLYEEKEGEKRCLMYSLLYYLIFSKVLDTTSKWNDSEIYSYFLFVKKSLKMLQML